MKDRVESNLAIAVGMWLAIIAAVLFVICLIVLATGYWYGLLMTNTIFLIAPVTHSRQHTHQLGCSGQGQAQPTAGEEPRGREKLNECVVSTS